jgi:hypothetical protein
LLACGSEFLGGKSAGSERRTRPVEAPICLNQLEDWYSPAS